MRANGRDRVLGQHAVGGQGAAVCWGWGAMGQTAAPPGTFTGARTGSMHSCAFHTGTGDLQCWGDDTYGQLTPP